MKITCVVGRLIRRSVGLQCVLLVHLVGPEKDLRFFWVYYRSGFQSFFLPRHT